MADSSQFLNEKQKNVVKRLKDISSENEFFWNEEKATPKFIKGKLSEPSKEKHEVIAQKFLHETNDLLGLDEKLDQKLEIVDKQTDKWGFSHVVFQQYLNGLPVYQGSTQVHVDNAGKIIAFKDNRISKIDISLTPKIDKESSIKTAINDYGVDDVEPDTKAELCLYRDKEKKIHLSWNIYLLRSSHNGTMQYFVDAHTGKIIFSYSPDVFLMSRETYSANFQRVYPGKLILKDDEEPVEDDPVAQAAHENAKKVYKYFFDKFERDSFDGKGGTIKSTVHYRDDRKKPYFQASWYHAPWNWMVYGDAKGMEGVRPLAYALDVAAHEMTHGVSSYTARFEYVGESGALSESFSDIFGTLVSNEGSITNWTIGEEIYTSGARALRDMSNPKKYRQPDHMRDFLSFPSETKPSRENDNLGVHTNSGIPNKVAYLIIQGETHNGISVKGIGRRKAEDIYYLALTSYLESSTYTSWTFEQARYALLNACRQLFGDQGEEYAEIKNAWASVGIGEPSEPKTDDPSIPSPNEPLPPTSPSKMSRGTTAGIIIGLVVFAIVMYVVFGF